MNPGRERRPARTSHVAFNTALACVVALLGACNRAAADEADLIFPPVHFEQLARDVQRPTTVPAGARYDTISSSPDESRSMSARPGDRGERERERLRRRTDRDGSATPVFVQRPVTNYMLFVMVLVPLLALLGIRRRRRAAEAREGKPANVAGRTTAGDGHAIVALACNRCSRVIDVPRRRLARGLFCPRCGSRMSGGR